MGRKKKLRDMNSHESKGNGSVDLVCPAGASSINVPNDIEPVEAVFKRRSARLKRILGSADESEHGEQVERGVSARSSSRRMGTEDTLLSLDERLPPLSTVFSRKSARLRSIMSTSELEEDRGRSHLIGSMRSTGSHVDSLGVNVSSLCSLEGSTDPGQDVNYEDIRFDLDYNENLIVESDSSDTNSDDDGSNTTEFQPSDVFVPSLITQDNFVNPYYIDEGDAIHVCKFCGALFWYNERAKKDSKKRVANIFSMCCLQGKVELPALQPPPPLLRQLFFDKTSVKAKKFHSNIRQYNNMFSFTSMGGKIDHSLNSGGAPYSFVLSGMNYHHIGSLLPPQGHKPVFSQLYVYDTSNEVQNRIGAVSKHGNEDNIDAEIVNDIKHILNDVNPFVKQYRCAASFLARQPTLDLKLRLISSRIHDGRRYNVPTTSEVAALIVGDIDDNFGFRDIVVESKYGPPKRINELHASYLPLQYLLLFPFGEDGYRDDVEHRQETLGTTKTKKRLSIREFFAYRLMTRTNEISLLLHSNKLLQQFIVDGYTMVESQRLHWIRTHQKNLRADLYEGLADAVNSGVENAALTGKRIVLPSSFTGGTRYMLQNYQDAMAICRWAGYPDIFLTFTCNPAWPEIKRYCAKYGVSPSDRPDILSRVFKIKLQSLMKTLKVDKIFGTIRAEICTIEFQKRGLPHAHILLFLQPGDKLMTPSRIDKYITAEIPEKDSQPILYEIVSRCMMHGPCGYSKPKAPCMQNKKCSKHFPRKYVPMTSIDEDGYPTYRRRNDDRFIDVNGISLDNRFVVPYNPELLLKFQAHINVEKCNQSMAIKYLFKYISKGNDRVLAGISDFSVNNDSSSKDEIKQYYNCRYISACEGAWRIFGFDIHHRYPPVTRLSFHLPNQHSIIYSVGESVSEVMNKPRVCESQFLSWMLLNRNNEFAATLTYAEVPQYYVYNKSEREWTPRKKKVFAIGRIMNVSTSSGELHYLRTLLTKVKGPQSYDDIKTVNGVVHESFRSACDALGLLDDDNEFVSALMEASNWGSGNLLRRLFVSMLVSGSVQRPGFVWKKCASVLSDDLFYIPRSHRDYSVLAVDQASKENEALCRIDELLRSFGKRIEDYSTLPLPINNVLHNISNSLIQQELSYDKNALKEQSKNLIGSLTEEQKFIFDAIICHLREQNENIFFFVHGYGGTGKTFLWNALASTLRGNGDIVLTVASSGIAATLLPSGRTAHSRFAIPIHVHEASVCSIRHRTELAELIEATKLIIWDEAPMVKRNCVEAFDRTLRDIMQCDKVFGGKCVVMGGDFRQILPVLPKGTRTSIVDACISSSILWLHCKILQLSKNMRLHSSGSSEEIHKLSWFNKWLLDVGEGNIGYGEDEIYDVDIPEEFLLPPTSDPVCAMVNAIYDDLVANLNQADYFTDRAILTPTIDLVELINNYMCSLLPGDVVDYFSCDSVCKANNDIDMCDTLYTTEFLNSINCSGLPPHKLSLKVGVPIMLLRNIDQSEGLCNGTRLIVSRLGANVLEAITLNGSHPNQKVLLHRMDLYPSETIWPFTLRRRQFPVTLSFAMTINKSQGQSLKKVGVFLPRPVFTHWQLYVALSRVRTVDGLKIYVPEDEFGVKGRTKNVVYKEVFRKLYV